MINQPPESRFAASLKPFFDSIAQKCAFRAQSSAVRTYPKSRPALLRRSNLWVHDL